MSLGRAPRAFWRYRDSHGRRPDNGRPSVISEDVKEIVEAQMQACFVF